MISICSWLCFVTISEPMVSIGLLWHNWHVPALRSFCKQPWTLRLLSPAHVACAPGQPSARRRLSSTELSPLVSPALISPACLSLAKGRSCLTRRPHACSGFAKCLKRRRITIPQPTQFHAPGETATSNMFHLEKQQHLTCLISNQTSLA